MTPGLAWTWTPGASLLGSLFSNRCINLSWLQSEGSVTGGYRRVRLLRHGFLSAEGYQNEGRRSLTIPETSTWFPPFLLLLQ